jgi:hypothetical protein
MFRTLEIPITIAVSGRTNLSSVISLESGVRVLGWDFTTPTYTNAVTTTLSVMSANGNAMLSSSAIARTTVDTKICADTEKAVVFSGFYLKAYLSGDAGGITPYTMSVILYVEDTGTGDVSIPTSTINAIAFKTQADAIIDQAIPVQNTWYTVAHVYNAKIFGIGVQVDTTTETLAVRITVDGNVLTGVGVSCTNDTKYRATLQAYPTGTAVVITGTLLTNSNMLEGRDVLVEVRKTSAGGTGNLKASVSYATRG